LYDAPLPGDLNGDEALTSADWMLFKAGSGTNFANLDYNEAFLKGDLDGDFDHDLNDFIVFRNLYIQANGTAAFTALEAEIPEPSTVGLAVAAIAALHRMRRRTTT
jgi:hypothetical protein